METAGAYKARCKGSVILKIMVMALSAIYPIAGYADELPEPELRALNYAMRDAKKYRAARIRSIDSLVNLTRKASTPAEFFDRYMAVGNAYLTFNADSSLYYYYLADAQARETGDVSRMHSADIAMISGMSVAGFFNEATIRLDSLEKLPLPMDQRLRLWMSGRQLFSSMIPFVGNHTPMSKQYRDRSLAIDDSLLRYMPHTDPDYRFIYAERMVTSGQYEEARKLLSDILNSTPVNANIYGKAAYQLALVYRHQGDEKQYAAYLAKAATSDVIGCVTEGWALPRLADWLYQNGELDQAFDYINYSLREAMSGNARMRPSVISAMVPAIDEAYRKSLTSSRDQLIIYLCIACFLFLIATVLAIVLWRQFRRSHEAQRKIIENSRLQEVYLGNFVALCSTYSARLQSWQKMVMRKLSSGQTDDLLKTLKAGKLSDENDDFHLAIDKALMELYPDFVEEVNALLRPDQQIHLNKSGAMTPELRICALMRLGVSESTRIATILQYSTNTIYTYRNKMRNKALNRDEFEDQIRQIGYNYTE